MDKSQMTAEEGKSHFGLNVARQCDSPLGQPALAVTETISQAALIVPSWKLESITPNMDFLP
jgi:hypothetical protein